MQFVTLLLPFLGLVAAAPGPPGYSTAVSTTGSTPCSFSSIVTATVTKTTYTSTYTTTKTQNATVTTTQTNTSTATDTTTTTITSTPLATSIVTTCAVPTSTAASKRDLSPWNPWQSQTTTSSKSTTTSAAAKCSGAYTTLTTTTTTTLSLVATATTTITTTGTATITTVTTTTTTSTATATTTTSTSTTTIASIPTFVIYVQGGYYDGDYFSIEDDSPAQITTNSGLANSASFSILADGTLAVAVAPNAADNGKIAMEDVDRDTGDPKLVYAEGPADLATNGVNAYGITCSIGVNADGTCPLNCITPYGETVSYVGNAYWRLGSIDAVPPGYTVFNPFVVG